MELIQERCYGSRNYLFRKELPYRAKGEYLHLQHL
jgi:hypothetical protein